MEYFSNNYHRIIKELNNGQYDSYEKNGVVVYKLKSSEMLNVAAEFYPALTEEEVSNIESKLGVSFPEEYRNFLLNHNGISLLGDLSIWGIKRMYNEEEDLQQYYDLVESQKEGSSGWEIKPGQIIIGSDGLGNIYVLDVSVGKIVSYDTEFPDEHKEYSSYKEFLEDKFFEILPVFKGEWKP